MTAYQTTRPTVSYADVNATIAKMQARLAYYRIQVRHCKRRGYPDIAIRFHQHFFNTMYQMQSMRRIRRDWCLIETAHQ
jgi:hypothetical protein